MHVHTHTTTTNKKQTKLELTSDRSSKFLLSLGVLLAGINVKQLWSKENSQKTLKSEQTARIQVMHYKKKEKKEQQQTKKSHRYEGCTIKIWFAGTITKDPVTIQTWLRHDCTADMVQCINSCSAYSVYTLQWELKAGHRLMSVVPGLKSSPNPFGCYTCTGFTFCDK